MEKTPKKTGPGAYADDGGLSEADRVELARALQEISKEMAAKVGDEILKIGAVAGDLFNQHGPDIRVLWLLDKLDIMRKNISRRMEYEAKAAGRTSTDGDTLH